MAKGALDRHADNRNNLSFEQKALQTDSISVKKQCRHFGVNILMI